MSDFELSLNTGTVRDLSLREAVDAAARAGLTSIGVWRDRVAEAGLDEAARMLSDAGLTVSSLCRGGFLTAADPDGVRAALDDNIAAIREAAALGTDRLIMVVGGLPAGASFVGGSGLGDDKDLQAARDRVADRLAELVPTALEYGVTLVLEPLHPMYAADRAVLSTLEQALDLAAPHPPRAVGVVVDTFHVWWDPALEVQIARAGSEGRLAAYQVCDFNLPIAADALLSRGMMGDGMIDFGPISRSVAAAGYRGPVEVEIFNQEIFDQDPALTVSVMKERYRRLVLPSLTEVAHMPAV
ncbi:sugar phosphate isomerase/epimerase family protein [Brevibacterium yomogidense]|uniref:sugar phosphate isomerase/epimerase family protein n=1 Tax=Brevibacterium yomogidense TaxID=946573 RepID=UPI0018E01ADF|nr:sugar phosphate isomerase/epimerase family protein [Brevibacterium yomogidense]